MKICPFADWRPLPGRENEPQIRPRIFTVHTMAGYLKGTEATFKKSNLESHFGIGGPWDPPGLDGALWQWQDTDRQADAQAAGNDYCVSAEVSDGGDHTRPFSDRQVLTLVNAGAWFCTTYNAPARLVTSPADSGFGYHQQFGAWNPHSHDCPGAVRRKQLTDVVIPRVAALLGGAPAPRPVHGRNQRMLLVQPEGAGGVFLYFGKHPDGSGNYSYIEDATDRDRIQAAGVPLVEIKAQTWRDWGGK